MKKLIPLVLTTTLMAPVLAFSLGLSGLKIHSSLNQPLQADVKILSLGTIPLSEVKVRLASPKQFEDIGLEQSDSLAKLRFKITRDKAGEPIISITSQEPITDPDIAVLIDVQWPDGQFFRAYTVLLDPQEYTTSMPATAVITNDTAERAHGLPQQKAPTTLATGLKQPAITARTPEPVVSTPADPLQTTAPVTKAIAPDKTLTKPQQQVVQPASPTMPEVANSEPVYTAEPEVTPSKQAPTADAAVVAGSSEASKQIAQEPEPLPGTESTAPEAQYPFVSTTLSPKPEPKQISQLQQAAATAKKAQPQQPIASAAVAAKQEVKPQQPDRSAKVEAQQPAALSEKAEAQLPAKTPAQPVTPAHQAEKVAVKPQQTATKPAATGPRHYGPVRHAENLWHVAQRFSDSETVSLHQAMVAIHQANPQAFLRGNMHGLKAGVTLTIPDASVMQRVNAQQAFTQLSTHGKAWEDHSALPAVSDKPHAVAAMHDTASKQPVQAHQVTQRAQAVTDVSLKVAPVVTHSIVTAPTVSDKVPPAPDNSLQLGMQAAPDAADDELLKHHIRALRVQNQDLKQALAERDHAYSFLQDQLAQLHEQQALASVPKVALNTPAGDSAGHSAPTIPEAMPAAAAPTDLPPVEKPQSVTENISVNSNPVAAETTDTITLPAVASEAHELDLAADTTMQDKFLWLLGLLLLSGAGITWYTLRARQQLANDPALTQSDPKNNKRGRLRKATNRTATSEEPQTPLHGLRAKSASADRHARGSAIQHEIPEDMLQEIVVNDEESYTTKLDLANTYMSMHEFETATKLLHDVITHGNAHHQHLAKMMLEKMARGK